MEFILGVVLWPLLIGVVAVLVVDSVVLVPAYHYGVLERLRKRTGAIYDEGLGFKLPLIEKVIPVSMGLTAIPLVVRFTTADKLQLNVTGSLQYRPDPRRTDDRERNLFISMTEAIIKSGIEDMLRDMLGGLGGHYNAEHFIGNRQAIGDLINNILKFENPYHLRHHPGDGEGCCGIKDCLFEERVDAKELISFYNIHWKELKRMSEEEKSRGESEASTVEQRYGIDVEVFVLANVDFSDDIKDAFEQEKEADARARAFEKKLEMARKVKELGANAQEALNAADVSLNPKIAGNKVVVSVEGQAGVLSGILGLLKK